VRIGSVYQSHAARKVLPYDCSDESALSGGAVFALPHL